MQQGRPKYMISSIYERGIKIPKVENLAGNYQDSNTSD